MPGDSLSISHNRLAEEQQEDREHGSTALTKLASQGAVQWLALGGGPYERLAGVPPDAGAAGGNFDRGGPARGNIPAMAGSRPRAAQ